MDVSGQCAARGLDTVQTSNCQRWRSAVPTQIFSLNAGLNTLQFQSVSLNPKSPATDLIGGTQDNGTWAYDGSGAAPSWFESVGGDGGQSGIDAVTPPDPCALVLQPQPRRQLPRHRS